MAAHDAPGRLHALRRLTPADWGLLAQAALANAAMPLLVRLVPLGRLVPKLERWPGRPHREGRATADRIARLVELTAFRALGATCLTRALALYWLLGRRGIEVELGIGARPAGATIDAHAWIRHGGDVILGGPPRPDFEIIWRATPGVTLDGGVR